MSVLLDTHVWVWWLTGGSRLSRKECSALDELAERRSLFLPAIGLWEAQKLHARGRLELPVPFPEWLAEAADERILTVIPLDVSVVLALAALPESFHGDPADRLIVATARSRKLALATRDAAIRKSRLVKLWRA